MPDFTVLSSPTSRRYLTVDCSHTHTGTGRHSRIVATPNCVLKLIVAAAAAGKYYCNLNQ